MDSSFFALVFRQKYISRWALMKNTHTEYLSSHSMECALIAHCLANINKFIFNGTADPDKVAVYALFHDCGEVISGDLPSPVKYRSKEMRSVYAEIEDAAAEKLLSSVPKELLPVYEPLVKEVGDAQTMRFVKIADKLCALIKCIEEVNAGNREFEQAKISTEKALVELSCPEYDYFAVHFLPAFSRPLDQL